MNRPTDDEADPELEQRLASWRRDLDCDDAQLQRMRAAVKDQLAGMNWTDSRSLRPARQTEAAPASRQWAMVAAGMCLALTGWLFRSPSAGIATPDRPHAVGLLAFTTADLRRQAELVCELDRVFEHQLVGIHQNGESVSVDITNQPSARHDAPQLILRFAWQQREGGGIWTTVKQEDVIGPVDHQFDVRVDSRMDVAYWSHLLPDHSLWLESTATPLSGAVVRSSGQYQLNHPAEVWSHSSGKHHFRMLVVYELLNPCGREVI